MESPSIFSLGYFAEVDVFHALGPGKHMLFYDIL